MNQNEISRGTSAHAPDLNWSQVRETVLMLELAAGQIEAAMRDSGSSVEVLTDSFTGMADTLRTLSESASALPECSDGGKTTEIRQTLLAAAEQVSGRVHQAIIAFQFYDKLVQRLGHVTHSLDALSNLVGDQQRIFNPQQWADLQENIRAKYTTPDEREMFEAVMRGVPASKAIEQYVEALKSKPDDDIELF
ncbi:MAG: hypothetical protein IPL58_08360 [Betaproteobacteria bacterium]|jgi:hypothetical protein|uniref:Uncharacterized protein n=1 Tax=Candidatus Proximibacter danicus TaxID=2954365 RepID=A0A9D7PRH2_9PROT|nr:hypothetical protein [Candidatus Proximibacter danicus]MBK9447396.1 hypothetical protein [Betaproteobacteria bacterium]